MTGEEITKEIPIKIIVIIDLNEFPDITVEEFQKLVQYQADKKRLEILKAHPKWTVDLEYDLTVHQNRTKPNKAVAEWLKQQESSLYERRKHYAELNRVRRIEWEKKRAEKK